MTIVAAISDTHLPRGARRLPEACLDRMRHADAIVHCGDLSARSVLDELCRLGPPVHAVAGNVDEAVLHDLLPAELLVELGGARIALVHDPGPASGRAERLASRFPDCAAVLFGHTHLPQVERHGRLWLLNPGSPTERRRAPFHSMLELAIEAGTIRPDLVRLT